MESSSQGRRCKGQPVACRSMVDRSPETTFQSSACRSLVTSKSRDDRPKLSLSGSLAEEKLLIMTPKSCLNISFVRIVALQCDLTLVYIQIWK